MTNGNLMVKNPSNSTIQVAIAVLMYQADAMSETKYLVARRDDDKHQGGKLEFVGGKIESDETAQIALIRETKEELGLDIVENYLVKIGRIYYDYGDKSVCLQAYGVVLSDEQFLVFRDKKVGAEGQALYWLTQDELLLRRDEFPSANQVIFDWLTLPNHLIISHDIKEFGSLTAWLKFYRDKLSKGATFVPRVSPDVLAQVVDGLAAFRMDMRWVLPMGFEYFDWIHVLAKRLTQSELMAIEVDDLKSLNVPLIVSCHDKVSVQKANQLARHHKVLGILLSPVKHTKTHPEAKVLGVQGFIELADLSDVPVLALGGLQREDLGEWQQYGAWGVAGIRGMI